VLVVVQNRSHPALWSRGLEAGTPHWIADVPPALASGQTLSCTARIRYRQQDADCRVRLLPGNRLEVHFDQPQWAVAPGQYVVFYAGDECLGGAVIDRASLAADTCDRLAAASA
jgi:tRNA-specific 2-thiouridylase